MSTKLWEFRGDEFVPADDCEEAEELLDGSTVSMDEVTIEKPVKRSHAMDACLAPIHIESKGIAV